MTPSHVPVRKHDKWRQSDNSYGSFARRYAQSAGSNRHYQQRPEQLKGGHRIHPRKNLGTASIDRLSPFPNGQHTLVVTVVLSQVVFSLPKPRISAKKIVAADRIPKSMPKIARLGSIRYTPRQPSSFLHFCPMPRLPIRTRKGTVK
jgi:hypothetical protein